MLLLPDDNFLIETLPLGIIEEIFTYLSSSTSASVQSQSIIRYETISLAWKSIIPYQICKQLQLSLFPCFGDGKDRTISKCIDRSCDCVRIIDAILNRIQKHVTEICILSSSVEENQEFLSYCWFNVRSRILSTKLEKLQSFDTSQCSLFPLTIPINCDVDLFTSFALGLKTLRFRIDNQEKQHGQLVEFIDFNRQNWLAILFGLQELEIFISNINKSTLLPLIMPPCLKKLRIAIAKDCVIDQKFGCCFKQIGDPKLEIVQFQNLGNSASVKQNLFKFCKQFVLKCDVCSLKALNLNVWCSTVDWNAMLAAIVVKFRDTLERLHLTSGFIAKQTPIQLLKSLRRLTFSYCTMSNLVLNDIFKNCSKIEQLILCNIDTGEQCAVDLSGIRLLPKMRELRVTGTVNDDGVDLPQNHWPTSLKIIDFRNVLLTSKQMRSLADCCGIELKQFRLSIDDDFLATVNCPSYHFLKIGDLVYFISKSTILEQLVFDFNLPATSSRADRLRLAVAVDQLARLRYFESQWSDVTLDMLESLLLARCRALESLSANIFPLHLRFFVFKDTVTRSCGGTNRHVFDKQQLEEFVRRLPIVAWLDWFCSHSELSLSNADCSKVDISSSSSDLLSLKKFSLLNNKNNYSEYDNQQQSFRCALNFRCILTPPKTNINHFLPN